MTQVLLCETVAAYHKYLNKSHRRMRDLRLVTKIDDIPPMSSVLILGDYDVMKITEAAKVRFVEL